VAHVDGEGELLVKQLEQLIVAAIGGKEVDSRSNVRSSHEFEGEGIAGGSDPVGVSVICAVDRAIRLG
jgi:hypothetical protein